MGVMSEMSFPLRLLGVDPGSVRLEHLLAGLERPLGGRPAVSAEGVALDHLRTSASPASTAADNSTAVPDMSRISRRSLRSDRSATGLAGSAATEFCR